MLKESDGLVLLGVTFDSKMTFEKNLRSVSRAASQRLSILRKSWQVFHDRLLLEKCFSGFVMPVLEQWSAVWRSAADTHLKLPDTLSGRTGSALVWHSEVAGSRLTKCSKSCDLQPALQCAIRGAQGVVPCVGWGCDQSIGSTVSDAIVRSWLWLTATRNFPLGYFGNYCK